jgi:uncharacterized protein (UPF0333 family)
MKKGQASIELLFVIGFAMLLIIPSLAMFGRFVQETTYTATSSQVHKIGNQMLTTATQTYHNNDGAIIVLELNFPEGIQAMEIDTTENAIIFTMNVAGETTEQVYYTDVPIEGTFEDEDYTRGTKSFKFTATEDAVTIERWKRGEGEETS